MEEAKTRVSTSKKLAAKLEIYEHKDGSISLENVRVEPHGPDEHSDGPDGLRKAIRLEKLSAEKYAAVHDRVEPDTIVIFKGYCVYQGGMWHW
ncbi:MAG TPA: hypothetical protein VFG95_03570 [Nitrospiria bacterium]|nr:hypothetical protein [Nitrospiria bacterium]